MGDRFNFKKFSILQSHCAMKVGTDGVLLGAWANGGQRILDIGSGTGLISLMMAQRFPHAHVDGVEIDQEAVRQALENVVASPFADQIKIHATRLQNFVPTSQYDAIVTNPPFFLKGLASPDRQRNMARHSTELTFNDIFDFADQWLSNDGELSAILPIDAIDEFEFAASLHCFFLARQYKLCTIARKPPKRCLISFSRIRRDFFDSKTVVLQESNGQRSEWYAALTQEFYI